MTNHITDDQIAKLACEAGFSPALVATDGGAFGRLVRAVLALAAPQGEPVAWLVSLPDEPELGEWFSEQDMSAHGYTSKPLYTAPAPAVPSDEREAFEAWARPHGYDLRRNAVLGHYSSLDTLRAWKGWQARAALTAAPTPPAQSAVPEGYVLVPVEPTEEMKSAGIEVEVYSEVSDSISALTWGEVRAIYRAMLTASQKGDRHTCPVKGEAQADAARAAEKGCA